MILPFGRSKVKMENNGMKWMKCMKRMKQNVALITAVVLTVTMLSGCSGKEKQADPDAIRIAVASNTYMGSMLEDYLNGIEMAIGEYDGPYDVSVEVYGENVENFEMGVALNLDLAENPDLSAVISLQSANVIDASVRHMEENSKAYFAVKDYDTKTVDAGNKTFFPFSLNAEHLGTAMGYYAVNHTEMPAAVLHDGLEYNIQQATAFDEVFVYGVSTYNLISSLSEPFTTNELDVELSRWEDMGVKTVYVPYSEYPEMAIMYLGAVRARVPAASLLACIVPRNANAESLLDSIEGTVMPAFYPVDFDKTYLKWAERYEEKYGEAPSNEAVQGYDIANLIIANYDGDNTTLAHNIRAARKDASGVAGNIVFDLLNGLPEVYYDEEAPYDYNYMVVRDGKLIYLEEAAEEPMEESVEEPVQNEAE